MKRIFNYLAIVCGLVTLASCVNELPAPLAPQVKVNTNELILPDTGTVEGTITITAEGEWIATSSNEAWFSFSPTYGNGNGTITVKGQPNVDAVYGEVCGPRSGVITIIGSEGMQAVTVKQAGEPGLDASRTYMKVTKQEELEADKAYLIVANTGSALVAGKAFAADKESTYSYIYGDDVVAEGDIITRPNANNGYTFVAKDGGYAIQQPNGRYLFQAATYNNFYSTTDLAKADVWSVTVNEDGTARIENQTVAGKYFQYSIGYSSYGAYGAPQDNAVLPTLYKDSAAPSDEVLSVADASVKGTETSVSIPVHSNKTWKVRNHDSWIKSFTAGGTGDGAIEVTFDANESYEDVRTATFQIIGETTNFEIKLTQDHLYAVQDVSIADFLAKPVGADKYRLTGVIISNYASDSKGQSFTMRDWSGETLIYRLNDYKASGAGIGDIITVVGERGDFKGSPQMVNGVYESHITTVKDKTLAAIAAAADDANVYYLATGIIKSIANATYGNLYLTDDSGELYVYGCYPGWGASGDNRKNFLAAKGIEVGNKLTVIGVKGTHNGSPQIANGVYFSHEVVETPDQPDQPGVTELSVSEVIAAENGAVVTKESLVTALTTKGFVISDGSKAVYVFTSNAVKIGDKVKVTGNKTIYNGVPEITDVTAVEIVSSDNAVSYPAAKDITASIATYTAAEAEFISYEGSLKVSGNYYNVIIDGVDSNTKQGSITYPVDALGAKALDGKKVKLEGYFNGLSSKDKYVNIIAVSIAEVAAAAEGIKIDGDMSDWANVAGVTNAEGEAYAEFKMTSDDTNLYFYSRRTEKKFADLWNAGGYLYYALDLDKNATTGAGEIWSNGPYEIIFVIWPFAGTSDAPAFAAKPLGESMVKPSGKLDNYTAAGKFDAAKGVELEFSIPRADLPAIAAGTEANAYSWGNKSGESMKNNPLAIKF